LCIIGVDPGHCRPEERFFTAVERLRRLISCQPTIKEDGWRVFRFSSQVAIPESCSPISCSWFRSCAATAGRIYVNRAIAFAFDQNK
jgi:hypothetical protein